MNTDTAREVSQIESRLSVLGDGHRSPTHDPHRILMTTNPYQPSKSDSLPTKAIGLPSLNGFALGVRNGLVMSIPLMAIVALVAWSYGGSVFLILQTVVVIPIICALCAGVVAEIKYRRRVPNSSDRRWIDPPNRDMMERDD